MEQTTATPLGAIRVDAEQRGYAVEAFPTTPYALRISHPVGRGGWWVSTIEQWLDVLANRQWSGDPLDAES